MGCGHDIGLVRVTVYSTRSDLDRRIEAAEERRATLATQVEEVADELWHARREQEDTLARERLVKERRAALAYALLRGEDPVIPEEDTAAVAELARRLPAAIAERRREERESMAAIGHLPLEQYEFDPAGARRRGFADPDEG
jgi:predicted  nucleic acid-binding Zn-ribbon protein